MTDELQRRSFCLIGVYRTFQLRGERRGLSYISVFSLFLSLASAISRLLFRHSDISISFSLLSLTALAAKYGTEERRVFDDTCKGKRNESGERRKEEIERERERGREGKGEREEFIIMSQGARCPLRTICCSREK